MGHVITGGVVSVTTTLNVGHDAWLFALSAALHVTAVVPRLNVLPDGMVHDDVRMPELSTAPKLHVATAVGVLPLEGDIDSGIDVVYGGHVSVGGVVSVLVMVNEHAETLLALSVAVHLTYVMPRTIYDGLLTLHD